MVAIESNLPADESSTGAEPVISVVIPTYNRPDLVVRSVRSALAQSFEDIEVIVVVDGRDEITEKALSLFDDTRLRILVPEIHLGNADARNYGVREARARWIAFLDDDDVWLLDKLQIQLRAAMTAVCRHPVVSCRVVVHKGMSDLVRPRRYPRPGEPLSEYLFCRRSPFIHEGLLITSTLFASRSLLLAHPFESGLPLHVDLDWVLRVAELSDSCIVFLPEKTPLVIWDISGDRVRVSTSHDWLTSLNWLQQRRDLVTRRAYASFALTSISAIASRQRAIGAFLPLLKEAFKHGKPSVVDLITFAVNILMPSRKVRMLADRLNRPWPKTFGQG